MKRKFLFSIIIIVVSLISLNSYAWEFQLGFHAGGQYLNLDALDYGSLMDGAINNAVENQSIEQPQPTSFSSNNAFAFGGNAGLKLGMFYFGLRTTYAMHYMESEGDNPSTTYDESNLNFDLDLFVLQGEFRFILPLWIFEPFVGIAFGYAYLDTTAKVTGLNTSDGTASGSDTSNGFDASGMIGLDVDIGDWFAIGGAANFSFIYLDNGDSGMAWAFGTDYLLRLTLRL